MKKFFGSILPRISKKTENDTVGCYRFRWNFDGKFYVRKHIFWASLKVMKNSKLKKKTKKQKLLNMMVPNFSYKNSYYFFTLLLLSLLLLSLFLFLLLFLFPYCPQQLGSGCSCDEQQDTISIRKIRKPSYSIIFVIFLFLKHFFNFNFLINSKPKPRPLSPMAQKIFFLT